jgi:hypothetical protein
MVLFNFPFITKPFLFRTSQNKMKIFVNFHLQPGSVVKQVTLLFSNTLKEHALLCYAAFHNAPLCSSIAMEPRHWRLYRANCCLKAYIGVDVYIIWKLSEPAYTVDNVEAWAYTHHLSNITTVHICTSISISKILYEYVQIKPVWSELSDYCIRK